MLHLRDASIQATRPSERKGECSRVSIITISECWLKRSARDDLLGFVSSPSFLSGQFLVNFPPRRQVDASPKSLITTPAKCDSEIRSLAAIQLSGLHFAVAIGPITSTSASQSRLNRRLT